MLNKYFIYTRIYDDAENVYSFRRRKKKMRENPHRIYRLCLSTQMRKKKTKTKN